MSLRPYHEQVAREDRWFDLWCLARAFEQVAIVGEHLFVGNLTRRA